MGIFTTNNNEGKYIGEFKNNYFDGKVFYFYKDGDRYYGDFKSGKKDGYGILLKYTGSIAIGNYKENKKVGKHMEINPKFFLNNKMY